jgi:GNAT superfamily N-acetyltransferase
MTRWGDVVTVRALDRTPARRELAAVLGSWASSWAPHAQPRLPMAAVDAVVKDYLARCDRVLVADPGVGNVICGWVARLEPGVVAYLYVMHDYRRRGIGERLLREAGVDPRGRTWRYVFGTPRMRRLCRPDPKRPDRVPWRGVPNG